MDDRSNKLPHEIEDDIISWIHILHDLTHLNRCALVSKRWLKTARRIFFSSYPIILYDTSQFVDSERPYSSHRSLMEMVRSETSGREFAPYAKHITLASLDYFFFTSLRTSDYIPPRIQDKDGDGLGNIVFEIGPLLTGLSSLHIANVPWARMGLESKVAIWALGAVASLKTLVISHSGFEDVEEFIRVISSFPNLRSLHLLQNGFTTDNPCAVFATSAFSRLESLTLDMGSIKFQHQILALLIYNPLSLTGLVIRGLSDRDLVDDLNQLLKHLGHHLKFLEIEFPPFLKYDDNQPETSLTYNTSLMKLTIAKCSLFPTQTSWTWFFQLLGSITSSTLEDLEVSFVRFSQFEIDIFDWDVFDKVITTDDNMTNLQFVKLKIYTDPFRDYDMKDEENEDEYQARRRGGLEDYARGLLPSVDNKLYLRVSVLPYPR